MNRNLHRLSPYNVADPIVRAALYREIRKGNGEWYRYEVQPDEVLMPELVAYRYYGTEQLKWVVLISAGMDDMRDYLPEGEIIPLPPSPWVRERIQYYQRRAEVMKNRA